MKTIILETVVMALFFWLVLVPLPLLMQALSDGNNHIEVKENGKQ